MDISDLVETLAKIGGLSKREQKKLERILTQLDNMNEFDGLDINDINDLFDVDSNLGSRPGKRSVEDFRQETPNAPDTTIDVGSVDDSSEYFGDEWIQFGDEYRLFFDIGELKDSETIKISLEEGLVTVSDPVGETLDTRTLPRDVKNVDAEQTKGNHLIIKVW